MPDPVTIKEFQGFVVDGEVKINHNYVTKLKKALQDASERFEFHATWHIDAGHKPIPLTSAEIDELKQILLIYQQFIEQGIVISHITEINLGVATEYIGLKNSANQHYLRALEISKECGDRKYESVSLNKLGGMAEDRGNFFEAERLYRQSLAISIEIDDNYSKSIDLHNLALIAQYRGDINEAEMLFRDSISCFSDIENPHSKALSLKYLGELLRKKGDTYEAEIMHRKAIAIYNYYFMTYELTDSWISLGLIEESTADYGEAHKCYNMSLSYAIDTENREAELAARRYLSNMGKNCGQFEQAERSQKDGMDTQTEISIIQDEEE